MRNTTTTINGAKVANGDSTDIDAEDQKSMIDWKGIWKPLSVIFGIFLIFFWLPVDSSRFTGAVIESLALTKWYAREHVILCLVPAFFIAGAIAVFVSQAAVMKYLGAGSKKVLAYGVASVSGYFGGLFLYHFTSFCRHMEARGRFRACHCVSLFRSRHQCLGDCSDRQGARIGNRCSPCRGCGGL